MEEDMKINRKEKRSREDKRIEKKRKREEKKGKTKKKAGEDSQNSTAVDPLSQNVS